MKLAITIERFDPQGGGAERSTLQIARELVRRGHVVTILAGSVPPGAAAEAIAIEHSPRNRTKSAGDLRAFSKWARQRLDAGGFDTSLSVTTAVPAALVQPRSGTILETHKQNIAMRGGGLASLNKKLALSLSLKQRALIALERQTIASGRVERFVAISGYSRRQLVEHYNVDPQRIELIPNAAEAPTLTDAQRAAARRAVREAFNVPDSATAFVFAAFNPRLKGLPQLLEAAGRLQARGEDFVLLLAGRTRWAEHRLALKRGLRERVRMLGPTKKMHEVYAAADVTVLPSWYDPSSKVVIESLMISTPAISTRCNGASDFICEEGQPARGRVIDRPDCIEELTQAMADLCEPRTRAACAAACEGLSDQLSMRVHVDRLEAVLLESAAGLASGS